MTVTSKFIILLSLDIIVMFFYQLFVLSLWSSPFKFKSVPMKVHFQEIFIFLWTILLMEK